MRKYLHILLVVFSMLFLIEACRKEGDQFTYDPTLNLTITDDLGSIVAGARVSVYSNELDYANAILSKNYSVNQVLSAITDNSGKATLVLKPGSSYYILITYFDNVRFLNISNITTGGYFDGTDLKKGQTIYIDVTITPDDGNVIFYTTNSNKIPITINFSAYSSGIESTYTLTGIYTLGSNPRPLSPNTVSIYNSPGLYKYYAKSQDGCVWNDTISAVKGGVKLVNLSKCQSGSAYFYTTALNDTLLPLSVVLNTIDTVGNITTFAGSSVTCLGPKTEALVANRYKGLYNYYIQSKSGRCVWTGTFSLLADDCVIIPIDLCD